MSQPGSPPPFPMPDNLAGNFEQAMRWMQQMWGPGGDPAAAMRPGPGAMPGLRPEEYERRIAELRSVERWLDLHLSMLRTTIQTLEMQRSALAAWQTMTSAPPGSTPGTAPPPPSAGTTSTDPAAAFQPQAWWNSLQEQFTRLAAAAATPPVSPDPGSMSTGTASTASPAPTGGAPGAPKSRPGKP